MWDEVLKDFEFYEKEFGFYFVRIGNMIDFKVGRDDMIRFVFLLFIIGIIVYYK